MRYLYQFLFSLCLVTGLYGQLSAQEPELSVLCELESRPGNPAVGPDGTIYFSMHPFDEPVFKVMRLKNGEAVPYPNKEVSSGFTSVIGVQATKDGTLWMLDMGGEGVSPKLVGWDTRANRLKSIYVIPNEASVSNSFHQDFAIDEKRDKAFIADMSRGGMIDVSEPAIVVIDLKTGQTRRVLSGNKSFQPGEIPIIAEGTAMKMKDDQNRVHEIRLGLNPIAIDLENDWVYFGTMTPGKLYRVASETLGDFSKSDTEIESGIEVYADKPSCDGIAAGDDGKIYITNVDDGAISIADKSGTRTWIKDKRIVWPDGLYVAPDRSVVVTVNQLNRAAIFNDGKSLAQKPYLIIRIK